MAFPSKDIKSTSQFARQKQYTPTLNFVADCKAYVLGRSAKATRNKRAALNCENCSICVLFRIILRLCVPKSVVFAAPIGEQFVMAALLDDLSFVKHGNLVTEFTGGQPVGDIDRGLIACDLIELIVAEKSSLFQ